MLEPAVAQEICDTISDAIGHNVLITDGEGLVIGSGDVDRVGSFHEASLRVLTTSAGAQHDVEAARRLKGVHPGITLPLRLSSRVLGTVGITGPPDIVRQFGEIVRAQTEIMLRETMLVRLALLRERALEELLADVASFDAAVSSHDALVTRAEELGFRLELPRMAAVIAFDGLPADDGADDSGQRGVRLQSLRMDLLRTARAVFGRSQDVVVSVGPQAIAVLCDLAPSDSRGPAGRAGSRCDQLVGEITDRYGLDARAGVGRLAGSLTELRHSYDDAWMALRLGRLFGADQRVHHITDHPVGSLLLTISPRARRQYRSMVLGSLMQRANWGQQRETIIAWCESGYRLVDTAAMLQVHRNTLVYRLDRLGEMTGTNLRDARHATSLYLACLLEDLDEQRAQS
ncbi:MAG TPA: sugar diacid recognition domain-containing protein [Euzebya sp.]|nr:sugar diacid recognition domain-containing protein [Euzebya sp.]